MYIYTQYICLCICICISICRYIIDADTDADSDLDIDIDRAALQNHAICTHPLVSFSGQTSVLSFGS